MKELWNKILYTKFHIGWVFGFLISSMIVLIFLLYRAT